ncbi:MAG: hypothetical protein IJN56_06075 [Clostridia bacterium]|nr:hypothetical protein [Clostridia bacterium]
MKQIEKNTVKAENQLKDKHDVTFECEENNGIRVMMAGNSITLHEPSESIGWHNQWGMAASAKEKDYVHVLKNHIQTLKPDATFCICQAYKWERDFANGKLAYPIYEAARNFNADVIVVRFIENCPRQDFNPEVFKREYVDFINYLNKSGNAKIILTTSFWEHTADSVVEEISKEKGWPLVTINDLGELDEMKALGLFEHYGVANHPGDLGMKTIADRIFEEVKKIL